jgi:4a-hydroxytetrahydrobiopterin dehydratase
MSRPLDAKEIARQLADLPGVDQRGATLLTLTVRAPSFAAAVALISTVAEVAEHLDHHPDVDLRWRTLTFGFCTHSVGGVTQLDLDLAHRVHAAALAAGATVLPAAEYLALALDVVDAAAVIPFWIAGLGYVVRGTGDEVELVDPAGRGPALWFQQMDPPRTQRNRFHLDVIVPDEEAPTRVAACVAAGGRLLTDAHAPSYWVLADPEGNEMCLCTRAADPSLG